MANLTNGNGDFTRIFQQNYRRDDTGRDSDDDEDDSFSLPSFSNSVRQQLDAVNQHVSNQPLRKCGSLTSLKEVESQNTELRRENFDLKLRLYMREKQQKNGTAGPGMHFPVRLLIAELISFSPPLLRIRIIADSGIEPEGRPDQKFAGFTGRKGRSIEKREKLSGKCDQSEGHGIEQGQNGTRSTERTI